MKSENATGFYNESEETMSSAEREKLVNERLQSFVNYAYQKAPTFKEELDKAGVSPSEISTVKDLEKIPVTGKEDLVRLQKEKPPFGGLLTVPVETLRRICISPGPIFHPEVADEYYSGFAKAFHAAGFKKGDISLVTAAYHMVPAGTIADDAFEAMEVTVIPAGTGNVKLQVEIARLTKVTGFLGFPSFLMSLIEAAEEQGYEFRRDFALKTASVGGEMLPDSMRRRFEQDYGISVTQFYAIAEQGVIAYECPQKSGFHVADNLIVEIVEPETGRQLGPGQVGEVVITNLVESYPLIRFGTRDLSLYTEEPCLCGRTTPRLVSLLGRIGHTTLRVKGLFLYLAEVEQVVSKFAEISDFQVVAERAGYRDQIVMRLELADEAVDKNRLEREFVAEFKNTCRLKVDRIDFVTKGTLPQGHPKLLDVRTWD